jgi:hypothetical protein
MMQHDRKTQLPVYLDALPLVNPATPHNASNLSEFRYDIEIARRSHSVTTDMETGNMGDVGEGVRLRRASG